jgi:Natural resistance-associated macrophage protein
MWPRRCGSPITFHSNEERRKLPAVSFHVYCPIRLRDAQEVEEERAMGRSTVADRRGATDEELRAARTDVVTGMAFSNLVMYFIILATGATLYVSGHRDIETARQAAEALKPLAGPGAYWLFTLGLIGTGRWACRCSPVRPPTR